MKLCSISVAVASAILASCAIPTTGVVPRGDDLYSVTRQGNSAWVTVDSLKAVGLQEADTFCSTKGKKLKLIHSKEIPAGPFGRWPESEVLFKCE